VSGVGVGDRLLARWERVPPLVADAGLAAVVGLLTAVSVIVEDRREPSHVGTGGALLLALQVVPLVGRRRAPVMVLAACMAATFAYGMAELPDTTVQFAPLLASYTVAAHRPRRVSVPCAAVVMVGAGIAILVAGDSDAADLTVGYVTGVTAWVVGDTTRSQRERTVWLEERRADAARQAAADERVRIARDLHDVVAHHVSVIAVQAEAAQEVLAARPDRAERAMADVAATARSALTELRRLLGVLRAEGERSPQPGLADVEEVVESVRRAGLEVDVRTRGEPRPLGGLVGVTVYRIVQEALTNVLKHAEARRAEVDLQFADGEVVVGVADDGRGARPAGRVGAGGPGHGLAGMRERVALLGGHLDAGPGPDGGFAVRAVVPLERSSGRGAGAGVADAAGAAGAAGE
jgi:signal transduction histidine kinase